MRAQRGTTLIEALVACALLAIGAMTIVAAQLALHRSADVARHRGAALRLAQQQLEALRSEPVDAGEATVEANGYTLVRMAQATVLRGAAALRLQASWAERDGHAGQLTLHGLASTIEPSLSGRLTIRHTPTAAQPQGRALSIPTRAVDLGDGRSVWDAMGSRWLFDNTSGAVLQRCEAAPADAQAATERCVGLAALPLRGHVRIEGTGAPPFELRLNDSDTPCVLQPDADGFDYTCLVMPPTPARRWSGRLALLPLDARLGHEPGSWRVCRYSSDADGDGRIGNAEHPLDYRDVDQPLLHQNFLVVRGDLPCPAPQTTEHAPVATDTLPSA